jgi:hypothetical protein
VRGASSLGASHPGAVAAGAHHDAGAARSGDVSGRVARAVVDDDHFVSRLEVLSKERIERLGETAGGVARGDDDGDGGDGATPA